MRIPRPDSHIVIFAALSVFALAPLTAPGYFIYAHDARHSVYFLQMFDFSLRDGAWYPRWATDMVFGYGYPLWLILAPLPFFAGEAFHLLGLDFVSAVKMVDGLAILFSGLTMYLFASRVLNKNAALVAAVAYEYIPYHLVDLYVRGAQAELVSFVFPPLVLWALYQLATSRQPRYIPLVALAYAGLMLTHISLAAIFAPFIGLYGVFLAVSTWSHRGVQGFASHFLGFAFYGLLAVVLAFGLAAIFVLPVLFEQRYLTSDPLIGGFFNYRKHFVTLSQLLSPFWGYGYAGEYGTDQFSLQLGSVPVLLSLISLWGLRSCNGPGRRHIAFFGTILAVAVVAMLPMSAGLWEPLAGIVAYVQFPWRLLEVCALVLAFLSGAAVWVLTGAETDDAKGFAPALVTALLLVATNYAYTEPQHTDAVFNYQTQMEFEVKDRELLGDTIWMEPGKRPQDSPLVAQYLSGEPLTKAIALEPDVQVHMIHHGGQSDLVKVESTTVSQIMFYTRYFPGWTAKIDGQPAPLKPYGEQGLILVEVPAGSHMVQVRFEDTPIRQVGTVISSIALLISLIWIVWSARNAPK